MIQYALFKDGEQVSKAHSTEVAVYVEAYELGCVLEDEYGVSLANGYEIKEVK